MSKSEAFYSLASRKLSACVCANPVRGEIKNWRVGAVDFDKPEMPRESSRWIVYLGKCGKCGQSLTQGSNFGGYALCESERIADAAEREAVRVSATLNWENVYRTTEALAALPDL